MKYNEYKSIEEISSIITSFPPDTRFEIPMDVFSYGTSIVPAEAAIMRLKGYNDYWDKEDTKFYIWQQVENIPCWDRTTMSYRPMTLIKIQMTNAELSKHQQHLNTPLE